MRIFRLITISFVFFYCTSCVSGIYEMFRGYDKYVEININGRKELKKKKYKEKFKSEMAEKIDCENVYFNYYEDKQINYIRYNYLRFFKTGQFAFFSSESKNINLDNLDNANFVGYYIVKEKQIIMETPTGNFNTAHYRVLWNYEIKENFIKEKGKETKHNLKKEFRIEEKIKLNKKIKPDW